MAVARRPNPPGPGPARPKAPLDDLDLDDDDFETAIPTPRPARAQTQLGVGGPAPAGVGSELEIKQGDGRIDTTGLELHDISDSGPAARDDDELEVSLPTTWSNSMAPEEPARARALPSVAPAAPDDFGEELDLSGAGAEPTSDPRPVLGSRRVSNTELDAGLEARSLAGAALLARAERVAEAHTPAAEPLLDLAGGTAVVPLELDMPDSVREGRSGERGRAAAAPDVEDAEFDVAAATRAWDSSPPPAAPRPVPHPSARPAAQAPAAAAPAAPRPTAPRPGAGTLAAPGGAPRPAPAVSARPAPRPVAPPPEEPPDLVLDTTGLPPPAPTFGPPRPAPRAPAADLGGHTTALDLDAAAVDAGTLHEARVEVGEARGPVRLGAATAIGLHARADSLPPDSMGELELDDPSLDLERLRSEAPAAAVAIRENHVPELEMPATTTSRPPPAALNGATGVQEIQLSEADALGPSIDLAEAPRSIPPQARKRSLPPPPSFDMDFDDEQAVVGGAIELASAPRAAANVAPDGKANPTCRTPDAADLSVPHDQVDRIAGYGEPPRNPLLAPLYALTVAQRRRVLKSDLARARAALTEAETERDTILADIFTRHRDKLTQHQRLGETLEAVHGTEADHQSIRQEFAELSTEYQQRQRELRIRREHADQVSKARRQTEAARKEVYQKCEDDYNRVAVRYKRLQIEHRNLSQQAQQEPDKATPQHVVDQRQDQIHARLNQIAEELAKLLPQAKRLRAAMDAAQKELDGAQKDTRRAEGQLAVIEAERHALEKWYAKQTTSIGKNVAEAEAAYLTAKADVVRAALAVGAADLDAHTLDALRERDRSVRDLAYAAQRLLLAFDAYDPDVYRQGYVTSVVLGVAFVLVLLVVALFR